MDIWLFYEVTHRLHTYCNPISGDKVADLARVLDLKPGMRVLDIASGLGQMLIELANGYGVEGVGVDASPYCVKRALHRKQDQAPDADIQFIHERGENFHLPEVGDGDPRFDVVMLVGASWIWKGYEGTLKALMEFVKPGGLIVIGEPHWKTEPSDEYMATQGFDRDAFFTMHENVTIAQDMGLGFVYMVVSSESDWDRYEMLQVAGVDRFAREEPDHADLAEIREKVDVGYDSYLRWGRDVFGFATFVFRMPDEPL